MFYCSVWCRRHSCFESVPFPCSAFLMSFSASFPSPSPAAPHCCRERKREEGGERERGTDRETKRDRERDKTSYHFCSLPSNALPFSVTFPVHASPIMFTTKPVCLFYPFHPWSHSFYLKYHIVYIIHCIKHHCLWMTFTILPLIVFIYIRDRAGISNIMESATQIQFSILHLFSSPFFFLHQYLPGSKVGCVATATSWLTGRIVPLFDVAQGGAAASVAGSVLSPCMCW